MGTMFHLGKEKCLKNPVTPNHQLQVPKRKTLFALENESRSSTSNILHPGGGWHYSYNRSETFSHIKIPYSFSYRHHRDGFWERSSLHRGYFKRELCFARAATCKQTLYPRLRVHRHTYSAHIFASFLSFSRYYSLLPAAFSLPFSKESPLLSTYCILNAGLGTV